MQNETIAAGDLCIREGISPDQMRYKVNKNYPALKYSAKMILTSEQVEVLLSGKRPAKKQEPISEKTGEVRTRKETKKEEKSEPKKAKTGEEKTVLILSISITVISIFLTTTGLFVFANWAGAMLGTMFSLFLFAAVWVARNKMKGATSGQALKTVWRLEAGAAALHCFTFWRLLPEFPSGEWFFVARIVICAVLAGFVAYLSYSAVLTVRDYNAET